MSKLKRIIKFTFKQFQDTRYHTAPPHIIYHKLFKDFQN